MEVTSPQLINVNTTITPLWSVPQSHKVLLLRTNLYMVRLFPQVLHLWTVRCGGCSHRCVILIRQNQ